MKNIPHNPQASREAPGLHWARRTVNHIIDEMTMAGELLHNCPPLSHPHPHPSSPICLPSVTPQFRHESLNKYLAIWLYSCCCCCCWRTGIQQQHTKIDDVCCRIFDSVFCFHFYFSWFELCSRCAWQQIKWFIVCCTAIVRPTFLLSNCFSCSTLLLLMAIRTENRASRSRFDHLADVICSEFTELVDSLAAKTQNNNNFRMASLSLSKANSTLLHTTKTIHHASSNFNYQQIDVSHFRTIEFGLCNDITIEATDRIAVWGAELLSIRFALALRKTLVYDISRMFQTSFCVNVFLW